MFPFPFNLSAFRDRKHPISQDPLVRSRLVVWEIENGKIPLPFNRFDQCLLRVVPKKHFGLQKKALFENASGKIPAYQKALANRGAFLSRIRSADMAAREKISVNPLLLHVEMVLVAGNEVEREREN